MANKKQVESLRRSFCRFLRFGNQLMRTKAAYCPCTMEQYHTLEAVIDGPKSMKDLASEVGFHQSTMTRIVEKLVKQEFIVRTRKRSNQRTIEIEITQKGKQVCLSVRDECAQMIEWLINTIPRVQRTSVIKAMETLTNLFSPDNEKFQEMFQDCCCQCITEKKKK